MSTGPELMVFIYLGLLFSPLAGAMAFLITYAEYSRHGLEQRRLLTMSLEAAVAAAAVIFVLTLAAGLVMT